MNWLTDRLARLRRLLAVRPRPRECDCPCCVVRRDALAGLDGPQSCCESVGRVGALVALGIASCASNGTVEAAGAVMPAAAAKKLAHGLYAVAVAAELAGQNAAGN